jgi:PhnB protein
MRLNTFLNFAGNCEQALRFYEQHLGGKITMLMRRSEQPDQPVKWPGWESSIQYAVMEIGGTELMASDVPPDRFQPMRSVYLSLTVETAAEAERIWRVLSNGAEIFMPIAETFFATRFGQLRDTFGTSWMVMAMRSQPQG